MPKQSAGLLAFRVNLQNDIVVFLVHPGGPFYRRKDEGAWSIPKGEIEPGEEPFDVAVREFTEETGVVLEARAFILLKPFKLKSGKIIQAWAAETTEAFGFISSNSFEMEWPPKSGKLQSFEEVDTGEWFTISEARLKLNAAQVTMLDEFQAKLNKD